MPDITAAIDQARYPNCQVQPYQKSHVITLNPKEPQVFRRLNFGPFKVGIILEKMSAIEQFARDGGSTTPDGCEIFEYRGHKMLLLNPGKGTRFQFGLDKANLIVLRKEALKNFDEDFGE